ncbi:hypothetical protein GN958_ATG09589 [Phytophthora infestans]|uniref:Uncharacterized protein n=1 Tax=Phytophthora infestans TaxID=4787 RepID=A0A8S9UKE4_PHYIN|nr:hypothetical protein GN958_ATG09589 [Phytophthora infestans]
MTTFINLPGASAKKWLWSVRAKAVSTFYGHITDFMRMDPLARLHGEVESVSGLACFLKQRYDNFNQSTRGVGQKWLWSVGAKAVSTFYGRITDSMRTDPFARLHGEMESVSELACFSKKRYDNFYQSTKGVDQKRALERRG